MCRPEIVPIGDGDEVCNSELFIYTWSDNFSHSAYEKSEKFFSYLAVDRNTGRATSLCLSDVQWGRLYS